MPKPTTFQFCKVGCEPNQTKWEGSCPNQLRVWQAGGGRGGREAHRATARELRHTSNSSLSKATQASFLQQVYGDKCSALSAKNVRAGRSAPHRPSISLISASAAPPKPSALPPRAPGETPPGESTARAGVPKKTFPCPLQAPLPQHQSPCLMAQLAPSSTKLESWKAQSCKVLSVAKSRVIKRILGTFLHPQPDAVSSIPPYGSELTRDIPNAELGL